MVRESKELVATWAERDTVFLVQFRKLLDESAVLYDIVVELIPSRDICKTRSGKLAQWVEVKTSYCQSGQVHENEYHGGRNHVPET